MCKACKDKDALRVLDDAMDILIEESDQIAVCVLKCELADPLAAVRAEQMPPKRR